MSHDFTCQHCHQVIDLSHTRQPNYVGAAGYADVVATGEKICLPCAGKHELAEMRATGKGMLYLGYKLENDMVAHYASDWAGTFQLPVYSLRRSWHNFAGTNGRRDFYFDFDGNRWHGVNIGDGDIATVRRTKVKARE